jgi:hypothetical protein
VNEPNSSTTNHGEDQTRLAFQWALPQAKDQKFMIEMCEMSYDAQGYPKYGNKSRMVGLWDATARGSGNATLG